ncbi:hypothetical protein D3C87_865200 [compost metagenome]
MYSSLKRWANVPFEIMPFVGENTALDKEYGPDIEALCYPISEVKVVVTRDGEEAISNTTLYVDAIYTIKYNDRIKFDDDEHRILSLTSYFENGKRSIWVVNI